MDHEEETRDGLAHLTVLRRATETSAGKFPPRDVLWALASLTRGAVPEQITAEVTGDDGGSTWRIVALTERLLVRVTASAPITNWTSEKDVNNQTGPASLELARAVERAAVTGVSVTAVMQGGTWGDRVEEWIANWRIHLGAEVIDLPCANDRQHEASDALARALLERLGQH